MERFTLTSLALCLVVLGPLCGCKKAAPNQAAPNREAAPGGAAARAAIPVRLAPVRVGSVWRTVDVTGTLFGEDETTIASKLDGRIELVAMDVGDAAPSGTLLARIETRDYELDLREAEASLTSALARLGLSELPDETFDAEALPAVRRARAQAANEQAKLDRARQLFQESPPVISEQEYDDAATASAVAGENAEAELITARALLAEARARHVGVAIARQRLADTAIIAPLAADSSTPVPYEVARRLVSQGQYVQSGEPMFELVSTRSIILRAEVPERFSGQVEPGQAVRVSVEAYAEPFMGKITRVAPRIDAASRAFAIEARIGNLDNRLKPGAFARGEIQLREEPGITFVPAEAVVSFAGVVRVFSVEEGKAKEHRVRVGTRVGEGEGEEVEILGGLPTERVIVTRVADLAPGSSVAVEGP